MCCLFLWGLVGYIDGEHINKTVNVFDYSDINICPLQLRLDCSAITNLIIMSWVLCIVMLCYVLVTAAFALIVLFCEPS